MKVYLAKRLSDNKYYLKKNRWYKDIFCESYFTEQAAKWHRTYTINDSKRYSDVTIHLNKEDIVIEEYDMIKLD